MRVRLLSSAIFGLALGVTLVPAIAAQPSQTNQDLRSGGGKASVDPARRSVGGSVLAIADDHFTIRTGRGQIYRVHFGAKTRIYMQPIHSPGEVRPMRGSGRPDGTQVLAPSDINIGDVIVSNGKVDPATKTVNAVSIVKLGLESRQQLRSMASSYGKTWLVGRVTAVAGRQITILGEPDNAAHSFAVNKYTIFCIRHQPLTLADIHVGSFIRVDGSLKNGAFVASRVSLVRFPDREADVAPGKASQK